MFPVRWADVHLNFHASPPLTTLTYMSVLAEPRLSVSELSSLLEAADPAAFLVAPRQLRRIIKYDRKLTHLGLQVPHRKSYVIAREALLEWTAPADLGWEPRRDLPATLLLFPCPKAESLASVQRGQLLVKYWQLLFHAGVHQAVSAHFDKHHVTDAAVRRRIHAIGQTEFYEIRTVLRQERYLLPPHDDRTVYEEFAALYLELRFFATPLLPRYFPAIDDFDRIDRILREDVDAAALFSAKRLEGAPDPVWMLDDPDQGDTTAALADTTHIWTGSDKPYQDLVSRADKAAARGNCVRAAIQRTRAARVAPPILIPEAQDNAAADLNRLVERLQAALQIMGDQAATWRRDLPPLLVQAADGVWPAEARLLYDLQKICVDHERPVYSPDLVEWAYSGFRQPLVRLLPNQPLVLAVKHLRVAVNRLPSVRLTEPERHALSALLHDALSQAETRLRERFRPPIRAALARVGLRPENFPEELGRRKLIEELLDRITERGYLNMSDLRDALARNQLKLPDLSGPREFFGGDPLICANRELAASAAGVYRRGEIYLRWLQRGSALTFGTHAGQVFMLFFVLPVLGAIATILGTQEILHLLRLPHHLSLGAEALLTCVLGDFYLHIFHYPCYRKVALRGLHLLWIGCRGVFYDIPVAVVNMPAVRAFINSRPYKILVRLVLKPLPVALLAWAILWGFGIDTRETIAGAGGAFLVAGVLLNSRLGRDIEEALIDRALRDWEYLQGLVPGLFRFVMQLFKTVLEAIDRFLYTVDEWLRFRAGQGRPALVVKTTLGLIWFVVTYVVRMYVNVFIEPSVNPIKHFPAVTVMAKILVPFWGVLWGTVHNPGLLCLPFEFLGAWKAWTIGFVLLHSLPGAAGFLVWEFKENWRLYRTNRPRTLRPEIIGHHGETMLRLLKPGFHSGTLPKLYAKLRRAERKGHRGAGWKSAQRVREALHHVDESVRHFAERELIDFVGAGKGWTLGPIHVSTVEAGSNRVRLELACPTLEEISRNQPTPTKQTLELQIEEQSGWLLAHVARPGWLTLLSSEQLAVFTTALRGFYQKAGVNLVREQIEACFAPTCPPYDIGEEGLIAWPGQGYESEVIYDLNEEPVIYPRLKGGQPATNLPAFAAEQLLFSKQPITWQAWVTAWEGDQAGVRDFDKLLPQTRVV